MYEFARWAFLLGALPFLVLGLAHLRHTPLHVTDRKGLSPRDPDLAEAMTKSSPMLTSATDIWRAWVGFNISHSAGAIIFALFVLIIGRSPESFAGQATLVLPLSVGVSGWYLWMAKRFWFKIPLIGIAVSLMAFSLSWLTYLSFQL
jgi:hypothetical protein